MKTYNKKRKLCWLVAALGSYAVSSSAGDIENDSLLNKVLSDRPHLIVGADKTKISSAEDKLVKPDISLNANQVEGRVIARLKVGSDQNTVLDTLSSKGVAYQVLKSFRVNTPESSRPGIHQRTKKQVLVIYSSEESTQNLIEILQKKPEVDLVEPDYIVSINGDSFSALPETIGPDLIPTDPLFNQLWGLDNTGQTGGTPGADIDAVNAWDIRHNAPGQIVGIIDTGVDYLHPDLEANIWTNPGEIPNNNIDDDGNGYIDDIHGIDAVNNDSDPLDDHNHGTHTAGTIGGVGQNNEGVVGVNWNVKIAACKFLDASGNGYTSDAIECVDYFTDLKLAGQNVVVTNNSWGGGAFSQALLDSINAGGNAGIIFSAAAGNSGLDNDQYPHYPSSYDSDAIIAVAATDHNDALASFSNYGAASVDLAAPGVNILSTIISSEDSSCVVTSPRYTKGFEVPLADTWKFYATNQPTYFDDPALYWQRYDLDAATGSWSFSDSPYGNYVDNLITSAGHGRFDLSTVNTGCFSFKIKGENEAFYDGLNVYVSGDNGATWSNIGYIDTASYPDWTTVGFIIPADKLTSQFRYALVRTSDSIINKAGYEIDDIAIGEGTLVRIGQYDSFNGTSMATPHVSGAIALAAEAFPNESLLQRRNRVLNSVDPIPGLNGVVATGGRLNLYNMVLGGIPEDAVPFAAGSLNFNHEYTSFSFPTNTFDNPVLIAGPATRNGTHPGVVRVRNLDNAAGTVEMAFKEWDYLDGVHATENVSSFIIEAGHFVQGDVVIDAGTFPLNGTASFNTVNFSSAFPGVPQVYLTAQTANGSQVVTVRAKDVTASSFKAALYEQQSLMDGHVTETIGYFAIYSPTSTGTFVNHVGANINFNKITKGLTHVPDIAFGASFFLEEEQSADAEVNHIAESVDFFYFPWIGDLRFAQDVSTNGGDTAAVRIYQINPPSTLYFSKDNDSNGLYILNTTTGAATHVGITTVNGSTAGLAYDADTDFLLGSKPFGLLSINRDGSGVTGPFDSLGMEGLTYNSVTDTLYASINGSFFTVDKATGLKIQDLPAPGADIEGLAVDENSGYIYGIGGGNSNLYRYDINAASWSVVGDTGIVWDNSGLGYDPVQGVLYASGNVSNSSSLYKINPITATATLIGDAGMSLNGGLAVAAGVSPLATTHKETDVDNILDGNTSDSSISTDD